MSDGRPVGGGGKAPEAHQTLISPVFKENTVLVVGHSMP